jgi:hypothetical protein
MSWRGIHSARVHEHFGWLREQLAKIDLHDFTTGQVEHHLRQADLQLWLYRDRQFLLITEILNRPNNTVLLLRWGVGRFTRQMLVDGRAVVIPWAKSYGCSKVEVAGRPGWKRLLGLKPLVTVYRGEI